MSHMKKIEKFFKELDDMTRSSNTSCKDFTYLLEKLGFKIVNAGSAGHRVITHPALDLSQSTNYNCGHNPGTGIKPVYIKNIKKFVDKHEDAIKEYLHDIRS